jgi:hypothetical protein
MSLFSKRHESFWLEQPIVLAKNITLIPKEHMTLEEKMNLSYTSSDTVKLFFS